MVEDKPISFLSTADLGHIYRIIESYIEIKENEISETILGSPTPVGCIVLLKKVANHRIRLVFLASKTEVFNRPENTYYMIFVEFIEFFNAVMNLKDELIQQLENIDPNDKYNRRNDFYELWNGIENKYLSWKKESNL